MCIQYAYSKYTLNLIETHFKDIFFCVGHVRNYLASAKLDGSWGVLHLSNKIWSLAMQQLFQC